MADSTKAPKGLLISGVVVLLLGLGGCVGGGAMAAGPAIDFFDSISKVEGVPFGDTYDFTGTGGTAAVLVSDQALCAAKDSTGRAVQLDQPSGDFTAGSGGQNFSFDSTFETKDGEQYQITCDGETDGQFAAIAVPTNISTIATGAGILVFGGLLIVVGIGLLIASLVARSRWKKRQQPGVTPPAPGAGYGGPAAPGVAEQYPAQYPQEQYPQQQYPAEQPPQYSPPPAAPAPPAPAPPAPAQYPTEPPQAPPAPPASPTAPPAPPAPPTAPPPPPPGVG